MKFLAKTALIIAAVALFGSADCSAVVLDKEYLQAKISEDLNNQYKLNNPDGAIIVKNVPVVQVDLQGKVLGITTSCDFAAVGNNKLAKVSLTENGKVLRTFVVPVEVKSYDTVLVTTRTIAKGEALNATNTRFEKRNVTTAQAGNVIGENFDFSNMASQRPIKAGEIIDKRFLAKETAIYRSNPVVAVFQSGGIRLSIEVIALENGGVGDYIKVRSNEYKKTYQGKVINSNQVLIQI